MRFVWGSLLGLLLCGTIVYAGISSEDLEDGVSSSSVEDILSLLRSEQLMRAEDGDEQKPDPDTVEVTTAFSGVCSEANVTYCETFNKGCTITAGEEICDNCTSEFEEKEGICKRVCSEANVTYCETFNKGCTKTDDVEICDNCTSEFEEKEGICKGVCSEANVTYCETFNKGCTKTDGAETCDNCTVEFEEKEGICKGVCSEAKITECEKSKKGCTKTDGMETCDACKKGFTEKDGICKKCDCGEATCSFDKEGEKVCTCLDSKKAFYKNECLVCDCGQRLCEFDQGNGGKLCFCPDKMALFNKTCVDCDCGVYEFCDVDTDGKKLKCKCEKSRLKIHEEKCVHTCSSKGKEECIKDFKKCEEVDHGYTCGACLDNYKDYNGKCKVTCISKGNMECNKKFKKCVEVDDGYTCGACLDNYKEDNGICRKKCDDKDSKCKNGGTCENDLCKCKKGYDGDFCDPKCTDALNKTCDKAKADCVYDSVKDEGVCECKDKNYVFKDDSCSTSKWCEGNPCKGGTCSFENGVGQCKCTEGNYFNYNAEKCEKINPCLTKKDLCGANQECNPDDGQCKCVSGYEWENDEKKKCKDIACSEGNNPCFDNAKCQETGIANTVKCVCENHYFYDGRKCEDGGCFLKEKKCSRCPDGTKEEKGVCEIEDKDKSCTKDCGFGWCIKEGDSQKCVCYDPDFVTENKGKCVLDEGACASGEVDADGKSCNCTGIYKLSSNGITCERKTCEDADIKDECESKNAKCVTEWDGDVSHSCECETGFVPNPPPDGKCVRPCELAICTGDRTCYLNNEANVHICKCPPSFKYIDNKDSCEPDSSETNVILKGLPVKKAKYLKKNDIDLIKLNKDVVDAMNAIYFKGELDFALLYSHKTDGDSIICDVWLQFIENNKGNADRWKFVKAQSSILPPALELSDGEWQKKTKAEKMGFCSEEVKTNVCGQHTECKNNQCSCKSKGYKEIKTSIRTYAGGFKSVFCEDIDECKEATHECTTNTTCINTAGDYFCKCNEGFKKVEGEPNEDNKKSCTDLCTPNPCKSGTCSLKNNAIDCACDPGAGGSLCDREDENFKRASKNTVVVGAVLGTILGVVIILLAFYIRRQRKNSYSEDFSPPARMDNAEMAERGRPMRGVNNRGYQN